MKTSIKTPGRTINATRALWCCWLLALLVGCGSPPSEPMRYYRLPVEAPQQAGRAAAPMAELAVWQLLTPVQLPDHLQRDVLWLPVGASGLQPLEGHRWAEPLREALPRVLRHDLALLRGDARVWAGAVPAGVHIDRQLKIEVLALEAAATGVVLRVRWSLSDPSGRQPLNIDTAAINVPDSGPAPDQLVAAYRLALWMFAQRIAGS
jgi:uncharacterized lipoprotein YmbA